MLTYHSSSRQDEILYNYSKKYSLSMQDAGAVALCKMESNKVTRLTVTTKRLK